MKGGRLARLAGQLCARPDFWAFCGAGDKDEAAAYVRRACGVTLRRELDHNPEASAAFHELVRKPFAIGWRYELFPLLAAIPPGLGRV